MKIPKLASFILLEGGILIMSAGVLKGILGMIPPIDIVTISITGICIGFVGLDSLIRGEQI